MATNTSIEWTEVTWNPTTGCDKISPGCKNCYAERMAKRLQAMGSSRYKDAFALQLHPDLIDLPLRWKRSRTIFVNSMSDLFHKDVPLDFLRRAFSVMERTPHHTYQILTKRSDRLASVSPALPWPKNVWIGVSVENLDVADRVEHLRAVPAAIRFLSCEPLLGPLSGISLSGIHWVIVGGESGPHARPMRKEWVTEILSICRTAQVPFFFKQWGGTRKKLTGRKLDGKSYDEFPSFTN